MKPSKIILIFCLCFSCIAWKPQPPDKITKQEYDEIIKKGSYSWGSDPYTKNIVYDGKHYYSVLIKGTKNIEGTCWSESIGKQLYFQGYLIYEE